MWSVDCRYCWWWLETGECVFNCFLLITLRRVWPRRWALNCGVTRHVHTSGDIHVSTRVYRYTHVVMRRDTELQPDVLRRGDLHVSTHNTRVHTATSIHTWSWGGSLNCSLTCSQEAGDIHVSTRMHMRSMPSSVTVYSWHLDTWP